jgi:hypothetical protein
MSDPFAEYDAILARLEAEGGAGERGASAALRVRRVLARGAVRASLIFAALATPFYLLVGVAVLLYRHAGFSTWPALLSGVVLTAALLTLYAFLLARRVGAGRRVWRAVAKVSLAVVGAYCLYGLVYLSSLNVKEEGLRAHYGSLHPLMRIATGTFILLDRDLVITDLARRPEDYERMGLPVYERSLHFIQADGYAHAVDLRTLGHSEWRNQAMAAYYRLMGFRVLRHVGTADHLHVSLPVPQPRAR